MDAEHDRDRPPPLRPAHSGTGRVSVCFDPVDDIAVTRAVHARCAGGGQLAIGAAPDTGAADTLALSLAIALGVFWRIPRRLHTGRAAFTGEDRAQLECEISWALHRAGIHVLWVLDAGRVGMPGWRWLHHLAVREQLHVILLVAGDPPNRWQAAALQGEARPRLLEPERLRAAPGTTPWWQRPTHHRAGGAPDRVSRKRSSTRGP